MDAAKQLVCRSSVARWRTRVEAARQPHGNRQDRRAAPHASLNVAKVY
jgi:hypothetical protein